MSDDDREQLQSGRKSSSLQNLIAFFVNKKWMQNFNFVYVRRCFAFARFRWCALKFSNLSYLFVSKNKVYFLRSSLTKIINLFSINKIWLILLLSMVADNRSRHDAAVSYYKKNEIEIFKVSQNKNKNKQYKKYINYQSCQAPNNSFNNLKQKQNQNQSETKSQDRDKLAQKCTWRCHEWSTVDRRAIRASAAQPSTTQPLSPSIHNSQLEV